VAAVSNAPRTATSNILRTARRRGFSVSSCVFTTSHRDMAEDLAFRQMFHAQALRHPNRLRRRGRVSTRRR
jgi:hypothetical protein